MMKNGGNKKLNDYLIEYTVPLNTKIELKYTLQCMEYYRKNVKL